MQVIDSYRLEEWLRRSQRKPSEGLHWREMAQYAISHAVNDYYTAMPPFRSVQAALRTMEQKWTNKAYKFDSSEHYLYVKSTVARHLAAHLSKTEPMSMPCMLFEQHRTEVTELNINFSYIVQTMFGSTNRDASYKVRSYMVDNNAEQMEAIFHLTSVFCNSAFARLPERIEVYAVLQDETFSFHPDPDSIVRSLDYMRLLQEVAGDASFGEPSLARGWVH